MTGVTMWAKTDRNAVTFKMNSGNAPDWNRVYRRKTISKNENKVIEVINITGELAKSFLTTKLPNDIKGTRTILYYKEKPTAMTIKTLPVKQEKVKISEQEAHGLFGQRNKEIDKITAEKLRYEIVGEPMKPCGACGEAKAKI